MQTLNRTFEIEDEMGKFLPAIDVFSASIRYLKDHLMGECRKQLPDVINDSDIRWVLTVPAIWNEPAKQFMREAAVKVCLISNILKKQTLYTYFSYVHRLNG